MKTILILLFCSFIVLLSCKEEHTRIEASRVLINETNVDVEIEIFQGNNFGELIYSVEMDPGDSAVIDGYCLYGPPGGGCVIGWDERKAGSGRISFGSEREKLIIYDGKCENEKMIVVIDLSCLGYSENFKGDREIYTYRITEMDFENAEPIGD